MMNTQKEKETPSATTTANQPPLSRDERPACAACSYKKRGCKVNCPLAPYFPAHKHKEFHHVRRLFGLRNVNKILNMVPEDRRDDAMNSLIYEANVRAARPAGGCSSAIAVLQARIVHCLNELQLVTKYIALAAAKARVVQNSDLYHVGFSGDSIVDQRPSFENQEIDARATLLE